MFKIYHDLNQLNDLTDGIFLHYTGRMYGVGCSAFNKEKIDEISQLKNRGQFKGYIVLFASPDQLEEYQFEEYADSRKKVFLNQFMPGNLSILMKTRHPGFEHLIQDGKLAVRVPESPLLRSFIEKTGPMVSTSVNLTGEPFCASLHEIIKKYEDWFAFAVLDEQIDESQCAPSTLLTFSEEGLHCLRQGSVPYEKLKQAWDYPQILFLCAGNTCRSPLAEYYAQQLNQQEDAHLTIRSAGLLESGHKISENSYLILQQNGIDASRHLSSQVNLEIAGESSLILCMTEDLRSRFLERFPQFSHKTFTMFSITGETGDIPDPYGEDLAVYEQTWQMIRERVQIIVQQLKHY